MSIINKRFSLALSIFAAILISVFTIAAQEIEAVITITSPGDVTVEGKFIEESPHQKSVNWTFLGSVAGAENLGARVSDFSLTDQEGRAIAVKKLIDGEYLADAKAVKFQYRFDFETPANAVLRAHISWLSGDLGMLMLDDLLPQFNADQRIVAANLKFNLPDDWKIISSEKSVGANRFYVKNIEKAVFLVGKNWREQEVLIDKSSVSLAISGEWKFADADAARLVREIAAEYRALFGEMPSEKINIYLLRFPKDVKFGRWEAETRGATLTIFSGDMAFQTQSAQLLHEQLRHELFHLWIPNNLALTGNYDWFYEGFTIYQALRTGIKMNQIRFEDFLYTLEQAYNIDNSQDTRESLIEAAKKRRSGANRQVYARGLLTAFLCDISLLRESKGRRSLVEIFREVYRRHRVPNQAQDGNEAILQVLANHPELNSIIEKYINGAEKIAWQSDLASLGVEANEENYVARLKVKTKLSGRQKDLLDKLGYNNWRKTSGKQK